MATQFSGSLNLTGSLQTTGSILLIGNETITGSLNVSSGITGSLFGSASWAVNAESSLYPFLVTGTSIQSFNTSNVNSNSSLLIGAGAGDFAISANSSIFLGSNTGRNAGSANNSNFLGANAGYNATSANNSNFLGANAGYYAINANRSNFLGNNAGYQAENANNSNFLGASAGYNADNASYSTLIGYYAGLTSNPVDSIGSNNIIIGTNITLAAGRKDSINIGGLIFGTGSYATTTGNPSQNSANGRIGINQPLPQFSLDVSGSGRYTNGLNVTGSLLVSGSTLFSGTHTLSGTNTITGDTVLSGSIIVSGSSDFKNSSFTVTGSSHFTGSHFVDGVSVFSGSIYIASGSSYYRAGNKLFNYGQWGSLETQSGSANTAYAMKLDLQYNGVSGLYIAPGNSGHMTRIYAEHTGLYNIQFSAQLHTTINESVDFSIWFAKDGNNLANSNTDFTIEKITGGGYMVAALNVLEPINSGSYVELYYSHTTNNGQLQYKPAQSTPTRPATPSVIVTVTQVA